MQNSDRWESSKNKNAPAAMFEIPSETRSLKEVSDRILGSLEAYRLNESLLFDIRLCIEEAVRNAIVHGNRSNRDLPVKIAYSVRPGACEISVEDKGAGFDYREVPDPTTEENLLKPGGRGVYLMRTLMDRVEYNERGNAVRMVKYF